MKHNIFTLLLLLTTLTPDYCLGKTNMAESTDSFTTLVFNRASSPIPYRIPALAQTRKGTLLAACDYRYSKSDVGWNNRNGLWQIDVVMKRSTDHGRTWSEQECVACGNENAIDTVRTAYGDPGIVADRTSDNVLLHCVAGKTSYQGATRHNPQHAIFFHSQDGGLTWDNGTDLTEMIHGLYDGKLPNGGNADGLFLTSGRIMQSRYVRKGQFFRLYIAHPIRQRGVNRCGTFVIYSDDFGHTWNVLGNPATAPSIAQDESKIEELPDGSVLLSCRDAAGGRRFNVFTYTNALEGTGTWGREVMPENMTGKYVNACNGEVLILPAKRNVDGRKLFVILQSVPLSARRDSVGFFYKELATRDDYSSPERLGNNWMKGLCVTSESSCYSTMVDMDNGRIGFLYEVRGFDGGYDIEFKNLSLEIITKGAYRQLPFVDRTPYMLDAAHALKITQPRAVAAMTSSHSKLTVSAWRGERAGLEIPLPEMGDGFLQLHIKGNKLLSPHTKPHFLQTVITDDFQNCGYHPDSLQAWLVPDIIGTDALEGNDPTFGKAVWCTIEVPKDIKPGTYKQLLVVKRNGKDIATILFAVRIVDRRLSLSSDFHLNFWQQPYAVSRYYGVRPWSQEHFDLLRPYMKLLARAGQRNASAVLFYEPWGEQSNDKFDAMIETIRKADGSWTYDYTVFDRWISFLDSCGINGDINCFSMVPWDMTFQYYDEGSNSYKQLKTTTDSQEYRDLWIPFLRSFAAHQREKGWFDRTVIAMDERGLGDMLDAYRIAQEAAKGIKMSLAGNYHKELVDKMYDYCIAWGQHFTDEDKKLRQANRWISTTYTACPDHMPNLCTNNDPWEATYLPLYCEANGFNGFLRWSWMNWTENPMYDSRFKLFTPGDTYIVYPEMKSSRRFERLIQGIQNIAKLESLRQAYSKANNQAELDLLQHAMEAFKSSTPAPATLKQNVQYLETLLNK